MSYVVILYYSPTPRTLTTDPSLSPTPPPLLAVPATSLVSEVSQTEVPYISHALLVLAIRPFCIAFL